MSKLSSYNHDLVFGLWSVGVFAFTLWFKVANPEPDEPPPGGDITPKQRTLIYERKLHKHKECLET